MNFLKRFWNDEEGHGMAEYGLLLALIAIVVIAALVILGPKIAQVFTNIGEKLPAKGESLPAD